MLYCHKCTYICIRIKDRVKKASRSGLARRGGKSLIMLGGECGKRGTRGYLLHCKYYKTHNLGEVSPDGCALPRRRLLKKRQRTVSTPRHGPTGILRSNPHGSQNRCFWRKFSQH
jgi:hypothetical protein